MHSLTAQRRRASQRQRGVSLIEALVALLVMSLGMLALVGVQSNLRANSDIARQRAEATRIASEEIERLRFFTSIEPTATQVNLSWSEIAPRTVDSYILPDGTNNTTYRIARKVVTLAKPDRHLVQVDVSWTDRGDNTQTVSLDTVIAGADPLLGSLLMTPATTPAFARNAGRNTTIPTTAKDLGDGSSAFKPPNADGVVWVFNNLTGVIERRCSGLSKAQADIVRDDVAGCPSITGQLLSGTVRFNFRSDSALQRSDALNPTAWPALNLRLGISNDAVTARAKRNLVATSPTMPNNPDCYSNAPATTVAAALQPSVNYFCLFIAVDSKGWGGALDVTEQRYTDSASPWVIGNARGQYKVCRYTNASSDKTDNANHPRTYCMTSSNVRDDSNCLTPTVTTVKGNLSNQNFLIIDGAMSCPVDTSAVSPASGVLVNVNTRQHQPY